MLWDNVSLRQNGRAWAMRWQSSGWGLWLTLLYFPLGYLPFSLIGPDCRLHAVQGARLIAASL
jgi:hypothetical protein